MILNLDFDENMKYSLICLKWSGNHPYYDFTPRWFLNCCIQNGIYTFTFLLLVYNMMKIDIFNNIFDASTIGNYMVMYNICILYSVIMYTYKPAFRALIIAVNRDYNVADSLPEEEQAVVLKYAKKGRFVAKWWVVEVILTSTFFILLPIAKMIYFTITDEFRYIPIVPLTWPAFMDSVDKRIIICAELSLFLFFAYYSSAAYLGLSPLGPSFMLHASGQLELLTMRTLKLHPNDGSITPEDRTRNLREIARQLQDIYDFVIHVNTCVKLLYELTLKGATIIMPILALAMIEAYKSLGEMRTELLAIFCGAVVLSSQPCYYGDMLVEKSLDLRDAVYSSGWETMFEKKTRTTLIVLMTRLERTCAVRSIFMTISLETLADVLNQAYALFNLLNAAI